MLEITFNSEVTTFTLPMTESILELSESAKLTLSFPGNPEPGVTLAPASASIIIDGWLLQQFGVTFH